MLDFKLLIMHLAFADWNGLLIMMLAFVFNLNLTREYNCIGPVDFKPLITDNKL